MKPPRGRRSFSIVPILVVLLAGCGAGGGGVGVDGEADSPDAIEQGTWVRGDEPWRGLLTTAGRPELGAISMDGMPSLPATAPAYRLLAPTKDDLQEIAETYAGGPVEEGIMPGGDPESVSFDAGDGWFIDGGSLPVGARSFPMSTWSWVERLEREHPSDLSYEDLQTCPAGTPVPTVAAEFLGALGYEVVPNGRLECMGRGVRVWLQAHIDGLPVAGGTGVVLVVDGRVVNAMMHFLKVEPLGELELAPVGEVVRRLAYGPGIVPEDPACGEQQCQFDTAQAELALAPLSTGGVGFHDHTVGNMVSGPDDFLIIPALRVATTTPMAPNTGIGHRGAIALSSAVLVDDPANADAARRADESAAAAGLEAQPTNGCAGYAQTLAVCSSSFEVAAGEPVVITISGEVNDPVGGSECTPILTLDLGQGELRTAPPPRSGTLVTARTVHAYAEPGEYTVIAHRASRCEQPAGEGGLEPEYDEVEQIVITVTG